jgi:hypothetical protein
MQYFSQSSFLRSRHIFPKSFLPNTHKKRHTLGRFTKLSSYRKSFTFYKAIVVCYCARSVDHSTEDCAYKPQPANVRLFIALWQEIAYCKCHRGVKNQIINLFCNAGSRCFLVACAVLETAYFTGLKQYTSI